MKKFISAILVSLTVLMLVACGSSKESDKNSNTESELVVFAASSMTETLTQIQDEYKSAAPDVKLTFNFDSSGTLRTQIKSGAYCDIFVSANEKSMNDIEDYLLTESRFDILENKVCLVVPKDNPKNINSFSDMKKHLENNDILMSIGNSDVPVGDYTLEIFENLGLSVDELSKKGCITFASNVKEVTTQVSEGMVDCGIVYQTDATFSDIVIVDTADSTLCSKVTYPISILKNTNNKDEASKFLEFLKSDTSQEIFKNAGFTPLS